MHSTSDDIRKAVTGLASGARSAGNVVKAAGQAAAGNVAGAVTTVLKDEKLRNAIIAVILIFAILIVTTLFALGAPVVAVADSVIRSWNENWDEAWTSQAIGSSGNAIYLYSIGGINALIEAGLNTAGDSIDRLISIAFPTEHKADNSNLGPNQLGTITQHDYQVFLDALIDQESLVGANGALKKQLNMIKARVQERGMQLKAMATEQYQLEAIGAAIAAGLIEKKANGALYMGVDMENSKLNVDTTAFEITDIQAIKILAAYTVQHDCDIASIDMWDLMDYCGWYDMELTELSTNINYQDSIYHTNETAVMASEIGGVVNIGEDLYNVYQLPAPKVPFWNGSFAPQWYYEQLEQIQRINSANNAQQTSDTEESVPATAPDVLSGNQFENLNNFRTFGLIDLIYTSTNASLTVSRSDYTDAQYSLYTQITQDPYIRDNEWLKKSWDQSFGPQEKTTRAGNVVKRTAQNRTQFILKKTNESYDYALHNVSTNTTSPYRHANNGEPLTFEGLAADTQYKLYRKPVALPPHKPPATPEPVLPDPIAPGTEEDLKPQSAAEPLASNNVYEVIDSFRTFPVEGSQKVYKLILNIDITYAARSIDDIALNIMGLWKGSLNNTVSDNAGNKYAEGYMGNSLLQKTWTDKRTSNTFGGTENVDYEFSRMQGYQYEAYQDIVIALATMLGYDTTGLIEPEFSYGENIVQMAQKEIEYYQANNMIGGARYWKICGDAEGCRYDPNQPWCVCFVNAIAHLCGYIGPGKALGNFNDSQWIYGCGTHFKYLTANNKYAVGYTSPAEGYKPVPGDFVYYGRSYTSDVYSHIGIVKEVTPDGKLITLEGNVSGNGGRICKECNWNINYEIGSYAYQYQGENFYVVAYAHPKYPSPFIEEPVYLSVPGIVSPWSQARYVGDQDGIILLAGVTRFRQSQLPTVVEELKENYPELYSPDMTAALASNDMVQFIELWNAIDTNKYDAFITAQKKIFLNRYVRPLVNAVSKQSQFNWTATSAREEFIWAIATTTDNTSALTNLLNNISTSLEPDVSDEVLMTYLQSNDFATLLHNNQDVLWAEESDTLRQGWISSIQASINQIADTITTEKGG